MIARFAPTALAPQQCPFTGGSPQRPPLLLLPDGRHVADELLWYPLRAAGVGQRVEGPRTCQQFPLSTLERKLFLPLLCDHP
eukprot:3941664-Rhodomonas_salina.2